MSQSVLPFLDNKLWNQLKIKNAWTKHTLRIWDTVIRGVITALSLSRAIPVAGNIDFLPSMWDSGFKIWQSKGLCTINQLLEGSEIK